MLDPTVNALLAHLPRRAPPAKGAPDSLPESRKRDRSSSPARSSKKTRPEAAAVKDKDRSIKDPASPTRKMNIPDVLSSAKHPDILPQHPEKRGRFCFPFNLREGLRRRGTRRLLQAGLAPLPEGRLPQAPLLRGAPPPGLKCGRGAGGNRTAISARPPAGAAGRRT